MSSFEKTPDFNAMGAQLVNDAVRYAGVTGVNFFKDSFTKEGFTDKSFQKWEGRKGEVDPGRRILTKSDILENSVEYEINGTKITFFSNEEYADIHNNGGTIQVRITEKSRKYFWYMYKSTKKEMWKWMALTKKDVMTIKIPARPFIQPSETLMANLDEWLLNTILKRFKNP
ncbi:MAG: phage virion morphogenesis protein [Flavobacteriaceae bacterium]|nr:phage virion morphogenesis protein [Flavobacteriaceae bacterium]